MQQMEIVLRSAETFRPKPRFLTGSALMRYDIFFDFRYISPPLIILTVYHRTCDSVWCRGIRREIFSEQHFILGRKSRTKFGCAYRNLES
jgi:hypothetical protein